ncbi:MAG: TIR domain-containing protein [Deltaproteobacteria bacterium]|nr:TIR domain-containing protein [Deltaproteobacteria bacterium]
MSRLPRQYKSHLPTVSVQGGKQVGGQFACKPDYVMRRIRDEHLRDSTVTIVMIGNCTWSRKYVDWELQASLRSGPIVIP